MRRLIDSGNIFHFTMDRNSFLVNSDVISETWQCFDLQMFDCFFLNFDKNKSSPAVPIIKVWDFYSKLRLKRIDQCNAKFCFQQNFCFFLTKLSKDAFKWLLSRTLSVLMVELLFFFQCLLFVRESSVSNIFNRNCSAVASIGSVFS